MPKPEPLRVFVSYSQKDDTLRGELETHLKLLVRQGIISPWTDRDIVPGEEWRSRIEEQLETADLILLLVSANFLASDFIRNEELKRAIQRPDAGEARVIPILLRPCDWRGTPFAKLQGLPKNVRPITKWADRDEAWADVARGIREAA